MIKVKPDEFLYDRLAEQGLTLEYLETPKGIKTKIINLNRNDNISQRSER